MFVRNLEDYQRERCGAWMRLQRERKNLTQKQVALGAGVDTSTLWYWETGKREPSCTRFIDWAHAVFLTPADAITGIDAVRS